MDNSRITKLLLVSVTPLELSQIGSEEKVSPSASVVINENTSVIVVVGNPGTSSNIGEINSIPIGSEPNLNESPYVNM
ncbi:hypothetical protein J6590_026334 [Homalodisca vitripennis]|nr:hypothetical protein J6590_026334 [Homalodisca vitripennis]